MDAFDLKLLDALQRDGRLTNMELAELVGLSPSQCSRRRMLLEQPGIIASYHAELSPEGVGLEVTAFIPWSWTRIRRKTPAVFSISSTGSTRFRRLMR